MSFIILILSMIYIIYEIKKYLDIDTIEKSEKLKLLGINHKLVKKWYGMSLEIEKDKLK